VQELQFGNDEPRRLAALAGYDLNAIMESGTLDSIAELAAGVCSKALAFVNIIDSAWYVCLAASGAERLE
jgi:hypothetical protein